MKRGKSGIVSRYMLDEAAAAGLSVLRLDSYSEDWLDFILACRTGHDRSSYDMVSGGVANDKVFNTVELYFDQLISKAEALQRLRYEKPNWQVCLRTEKALACLRYEGSEQL